MNKIILSEIEDAKRKYPLVLNEIKKALVKNYSEKKFKILLTKLYKITKKDIALIGSYIFWGDDDEDFENLSLKISLPEPKVIENISQEELNEIYEIVKQEDYRISTIDPFERKFFMFFNDYFQNILEINLQYLLQHPEGKI